MKLFGKCAGALCYMIVMYAICIALVVSVGFALDSKTEVEVDGMVDTLKQIYAERPQEEIVDEGLITVDDLPPKNTEFWKKEYVVKVYNQAINSQSTHNIPAQIITAQACLETGYGKNIPTDINTGRTSNNHFGIKGKGTVGSVSAMTSIMSNGELTSGVGEFAAYNNFEESLAAYTKLLNDNYKPNDPDSIEAWARSLGSRGYASGPQYSNMVIQVINYWEL